MFSFDRNNALPGQIGQPVEVKIAKIKNVKIQIKDQALWASLILGLGSFTIVFLYYYYLNDSFFPLLNYLVAVGYSWHLMLVGFILGFLRIKYQINGDLERYQILRSKLRRYIVPCMGISTVSD